MTARVPSAPAVTGTSVTMARCLRALDRYVTVGGVFEVQLLALPTPAKLVREISS